MLARQPDNATALVGLANVLTQRGHPDEADALLARANATGHGQLVATARAVQLRAQAQQAAEPDTAIALYRAAVAAAPSDPWICLDLARLLLKQGQGGDARTVMAVLTDSGTPSVDALHAAALFASEDNRPDDAASLASRIPAASRPADLSRMLANARFQQQVRQRSLTPPHQAMHGNACSRSPPHPTRWHTRRGHYSRPGQDQRRFGRATGGGAELATNRPRPLPPGWPMPAHCWKPGWTRMRRGWRTRWMRPET